MRAKLKQGLTLTEVMVSTVIFTFIMGGLYSTLMVGRMSWQSYDVAVQAQREARKAVDALTRDFRVADNLSINVVEGGLLMSFTHPDDGTVNYSWSTTGNDANCIIRQTTATSRTIARHISAFSVVQGTDDITMDLTATAEAVQGHDSIFQLSKKVAKRY